jgi:hypothetical protein
MANFDFWKSIFTNVLLFGFLNQVYIVYHTIIHFWFESCIQKFNIAIPYDSFSYTVRKKIEFIFLYQGLRRNQKNLSTCMKIGFLDSS